MKYDRKKTAENQKKYQKEEKLREKRTISRK